MNHICPVCDAVLNDDEYHNLVISQEAQMCVPMSRSEDHVAKFVYNPPKDATKSKSDAILNYQWITNLISTSNTNTTLKDPEWKVTMCMKGDCKCGLEDENKD